MVLTPSRRQLRRREAGWARPEARPDRRTANLPGLARVGEDRRISPPSLSITALFRAAYDLMSGMNAPAEERSGLTLPWGWLTLVLGIITITALGTLAVIAKKQGADTLSTIALALAILSFSAQLIITLAQAYNGTMQIAQADRVNADTRASLAEIRATSNALLSTQREQFSEVLRAALKSAVPAAVEDVASPDGIEDDDRDKATKDLEERLLVRVNEALAAPSYTAPITEAPPKRELPPIVTKLNNYPDEKRGRELLEILNSLPPRSAAYLGRNATLIRDRAVRGLPPNIIVRGTTGKGHQSLIDQGLIDLIEIPPNKETGEQRYRLELTDLGTEVASLLVGTERTPTWLKEAD